MESTSRTAQTEPETPPAAGGGGAVAALSWLTAVQALLVFAQAALAATLLLVAVVLQITFGYARELAVHVPLGVAIFGTSLWLLIGTRHLRRA